MTSLTTGWNYASLYWAVWFGILFLGPELFWLFTAPQNTLSAQVWHLEDLKPGVPWNFVHFLVAILVLWLFFHFSFGWFR